jgi:hypothetical protein
MELKGHAEDCFGSCYSFRTGYRHDMKALVALMTEDHCFVDGLGQTIRGRESMKQGGVGYFGWFPDYCIKIDDIVCKGKVVGLFGAAHGTQSANGKLPPRITVKSLPRGRQWCKVAHF